MKGSGGAGSDSDNGGHGGGEGTSLETVLRNITADMFPLELEIVPAHTSLLFAGSAGEALAFFCDPGVSASINAPGLGGQNAWVQDDGGIDFQNHHVSFFTGIYGGNGRWGVAGLRGGEGGGALGGSGLWSEFYGSVNTWAGGRRGCGGGGTMSGLTAVAGGPGFIQIYW
jgi:hypothetical protein